MESRLGRSLALPGPTDGLCARPLPSALSGSQSVSIRGEFNKTLYSSRFASRMDGHCQ